MEVTPSPGAQPRIGLVLGAGGVVGAAWMTGALAAVVGRLPCPASEVDVMVGTSAGSVLAAALRCGVSIDDLIALQRGEPVSVLPGADAGELTDGPLPPLPHLRVGSPRLMLAAMLRPHRVHPWVGASAWVLRGRGQHTALRATVHALHEHHRAASGRPPVALMAQHRADDHRAGEHRAGEHWGGEHWVDGHTWIVAVDYDTGRRVVFGRPGAPPARLADAVVASCSIPGWYEPAVIDGRRYVDGGVRSPTSLGLLARAGVDEVYVLAPMASVQAGRTRKPHERLERRLRQLITQALLREAQALRSTGIRITILTPGPEDLAVMGVNLMDPRRRAAVLETSLRTSAAALAAAGDQQQAA